MKFGAYLQENQFPPWRLSYFSYNRLKQELKRRQYDHPWSEKDEREFIDLIDNECIQVDDFIYAKLKEFDSRILYCKRTQDAQEALKDLLFDLDKLSTFIRLNFTALQKMLKKHDRWTGLDLQTVYIEKLKRFDTQRLDKPAAAISALENEYKKNTKEEVFWVHDLQKVKSTLSNHANKHTDSDLTFVYLDTANFDYYTKLLQKDKDAETIRLKSLGYSKELNAERTRTHEHLFSMTEDQLALYVSDQEDMPSEFEDMEPVLRITYHRTTFTFPDQKIHLDTDITFYHADNILRFPYPTLKLSTRPDWLTEHLHSVPHFSKYLHGVSQFFQVILLPAWLTPDRPSSIQIKETPKQEEEAPLLPPENKEKLLAQKIPDDLELGRPQIKVKLDSKTFFSNERTFISWLQFSALLLTASINLLNFGDTISRIAGGVFVGIAAGVALYSLYRFERRAWMIGHRSIGRYQDIWGPAVLCAVLVAALVVNIYLRFR